jgi:putative peptidoglycan binding protein
MTDSGIQHEEELDNWFDEPDTSGAWDARSARLGRSMRHDSPSPAREDGMDWIGADSPATTTDERLPARVAGLLRRRRGAPAAAAAVLVVVCLLGGLAAAGVFSSSHSQATPATAPTAGAPTTATTTPVTQTQPALAAPAATLKPGDQGAAVKVLQRALARLGYSPGRIDGQYGPSTVDAVTRFQRAGGLTADGILGSNTLRALARALKTG